MKGTNILTVSFTTRFRVSVTLLVLFLLLPVTVLATRPIGSGTTIEFAADSSAVSGNTAQMRAVIAVDLDGDGDLDLISGRDSTTSNEVRAWQNNGSPFGGAWSETQVGETGTGTNALTAADLDHDGYIDLIGGGTNDQVYIFQGNSTPFTGPWTTSRDISASSPGNVNGLAVADIDRDGDLDIISAHTSSSGSEVTVWENPYDRSTNPNIFDEDWTARGLSQSTSKTANAVAVADIDRDGYLDLVVGFNGTTGAEVIVWENTYDTTAWTFTQHNVDSGSGTVNSVAVGDIDRDGWIDIVQGSSDDEVVVWENTSDATAWTFSEHVAATTLGDDVKAVALADLDNDGYLDIAAGTGTAATYEVLTFANDVDATFDWSFTQHNTGATSTSIMGLAVGDLDNDGDTDLATARDNTTTSGEYEVAAWENNAVHRNAPCDSGVDIDTLADGAHSVFAADLDNDGDLDILSASYQDDTIAWYENNGATEPSFTATDVYTLADGARSVFAADMDNDGDLDILSASYLDDTIAWYENDGATDPSFTANNVDTSADGAYSVFAADMDNDGDLDILSASYEDNTITWYENDGAADPSFTANNVDTSADGARSVFAADMDNDGDLDILAAALLDTNTITWYENDGAADPSFTANNVDTSGDGAASVFAADMDNDGDLDILAALYIGNTIVWYENDGAADPSFTANNVDTSANGAASVFATDMDNDGDLDILAALYSDNTIVWYENDGAANPSFTARNIDTSAGGPRSVFAADLDNDGDQGVLAALYQDDTITWYENEGGSAGFAVTDTAPSNIADGTESDVLQIDFTHNGISGDRNLELASANIEVLHSDCTTAYTTTAAAAIIDDINVRLDDGDGVFSTTLDSAVATVDTLSLNGGVQTINFTNDDGRVWLTQTTTISRTYWISIKTTVDASGQTTSGFCIQVDPDAGFIVEGKTPDFSVSLQDTGPTSTGGINNTPTAVKLTSFAAAPVAGGIEVTWETATELDNLGFNLYRGTAPEGPFDQLNATLIPTQHPGQVLGATYTWLDDSVASGGTYYYLLEDVDIGGTATTHGPVSASLQSPTALLLTGIAAHGSGLAALASVAALAAIVVAGGMSIHTLRRRKK